MAALQLCILLFIVAALSSFTIISASEPLKSDEKTVPVSSDDTSSQEDSKEKRSQEEILFGNQQNKPNGLVDDLMEMENAEEDTAALAPEEKSKESQVDEQTLEEGEKDGKNEKRIPSQDEEQNEMTHDQNDMVSGSENWYNTIPVSPSAMHYLTNAPALKSLPSEDFTNGLYDQEDLYRRKRQLLEHPLPIRKRSLRTSLGQMIQKRGIRLPRRSMRLKRQVDMEDLLNLFGNERFYEDDGQVVAPHSFGGRAQTVAKRHVAGRFSGYPEQRNPEFRYPYVFQHRDDGILSADNEPEESNDALEDDNLEDIDSLMMMPPNSRYVDPASDLGLSPYRSREEENDNIQKWLSRHTTPSVFRVSRRSAPYFYPIDYRYMPGYKKRSSFRNANRPVSRFDDDGETDFGKWGHVVQVPEAYASPEDVARLYGLANLMAEGDDSEPKMRRSI